MGSWSAFGKVLIVWSEQALVARKCRTEETESWLEEVEGTEAASSPPPESNGDPSGWLAEQSAGMKFDPFEQIVEITFPERQKRVLSSLGSLESDFLHS